MAVIKLGGVNGSGKTTVARGLLNIGPKWKESEFILASGKKSKFYRTVMADGTPVFVLGKYDNACGGMDTISDKDDRLGFVHEMAGQWASRRKGGIVFYEGLITGKTYGAMGELSEEHLKKDIPWLYAFMDTPFDVCVERVLARRAAAGNHAEFDPERTMRPTYNSCVRLQQKLENGELHSHPTISLPHKKGGVTLATMLLAKAGELNRASR